MIIYEARNRNNNKVYIGQTVNSLKHRKYYHEYSAKHSSTIYFHRALMKYGFDAFEWSIIDTAKTRDELDSKEIEWIKKTNSNDKKYGFNILEGGKSPRLTNEIKKKISIGNTGKVRSAEVKKQISETRAMKFDSKELLVLYKSGKTSNQIGEIFSCSGSTIRKNIAMTKTGRRLLKKRHNKGYKSNEHPMWRSDLNVERIIQLRKNGLSLVKIAEIMKCSRRAIENRLGRGKKNDLTKKSKLKVIRKNGSNVQYERPRLREVGRSDIMKFISNGATIKETCEHFGIGQTTLYRRLQEANE